MSFFNYMVTFFLERNIFDSAIYFNEEMTRSLTQCLPAMVGMNVALMNQGSPRQSSISKVFDPMELLMPMEP